MRTDRYKEEPVKNGRNKLKAALITVLALALILAGVTAYFYMSTKNSISLSFKGDGSDVEFGSNHPAMDYVADSSGEVTPDLTELDTSSLGSHELVYTVTKPVFKGLMNPSKQYTLTYNVVDTTAPLTLWSGDGAVLAVGEEFDISKVIGYGDNADPEPKVEYSGKVNMDEPGEYPLHIKVSDASGNATEWDMTLEVAEQLPEYEDDSERLKFADFKKKYGGEGRSLGIDVSSWQNDIDFEAVKKAGCEFVIIRIGFSTGDGEVATLDNTYKQNLKNAKAAGLKVGVYLYSYDSSEEQVRASADWVVEQLGEEKLDLPVVFDWEEFGQFQTYKISFAELNRMYDAFADELSNSGYDCMLYGSAKYLDAVWEDTDTRPVWLAHYAEKTDYEGPYKIWQMSSIGRIKGIEGDVDLDIMYN